jgi:diguanylate cyclase (GGDEF)-like protein
MIRTTLQARLIVLMVMSSIFLISTFTAIQLNNQLQRAAEFNLYRARLGTLVTKDKLQELFTTSGAGASSYAISSKVKQIFSSLVASDVIESADLLDENALPLTSAGKSTQISDNDIAILQRISKLKDRSRWFFPFIDKNQRTITLYILVDNPYNYVAKLTFSLGNLQQALNDVYVPVILTVAIVVAGNIFLAVLLSRGLIAPVKTLNQATKDIAAGNLEQKVSIKTQDELEELADTFNYMTVELKKMKARAESANPLTKLPGNIVILEEVEKRIKHGEKFILIYCDLDNFKAFNDKYGVRAGDEAIMMTAEVFKEAMMKRGKEDDFIGHEGGDDFLLLTAPERAETIGDYITKEFDKRIVALYSKEDLEQGYIVTKSRESEHTVKYPIMTISLAGVSNAARHITSYAQLTNVAAEVKKAAKKVKGSKLIIDRRAQDRGIEEREEELQR